MALVWPALCLIFAVTGQCTARDAVTRRPGESTTDLVSRLLPKGTELAHPPVTGTFGPGPGNIVVLFRTANDTNTNYTGWVLVPAGAGKFHHYVLPAMPEIAGQFEITVEAIVFANADNDSRRELLVLYSYHRNGSEQDDSHAVHAYKWDGRAFVAMEKLDEQLAGLKDAASVRRKLKTLGVKTP
jgi:hypothetical protein